MLYPKLVSEEQQMYELLKRAQGQEDWTLKVSGNDPQTPLVKRLVDFEMFETVTAMYGGRVVKLTAVGRAAVTQADAAGRQAVGPSPQASTITFRLVLR